MKCELDKINETIDGFKYLPSGWNRGDEIKISDKVRIKTKILNAITELFDFQKVIFPEDNGGIIFGFIKDDYYLSFIVRENCLEDFSVEKGMNYDFVVELEKDEIDWKELLKILYKYNKK